MVLRYDLNVGFRTRRSSILVTVFGRTETLTWRHICGQRPTTGLQETRQLQRSVSPFAAAFAVGDRWTEPSMAGGAHCGVLQCVGPIRPE